MNHCIKSFTLNYAADTVARPKIIQPLILPGLSFFNAVPSLHLHILTRQNPPILALWFSSIFASLWLASFICYLVSCNLPASVTPLTLRQIECSTGSAGVMKGPTPAMWWIVVMFELIFVVLYTIHAAMAWKVKKTEEKKKAEDNARGVVHMTTPEEAALARERWRKMTEF